MGRRFSSCTLAGDIDGDERRESGRAADRVGRGSGRVHRLVETIRGVGLCGGVLVGLVALGLSASDLRRSQHCGVGSAL